MAASTVRDREELGRQTVADLLERLGGIPARRVRLRPTPGTATEQDVIEVHDREKKLCELVDGVLVEKVMGFDESRVSTLLAGYLIAYLNRCDLGAALSADGMMKLFPGLVRIPDVSFISWARYPRGKRGRREIPAVVPDLAVEILSKGNTRKEMARKLNEYFRAGVRLVWLVDPKTRTAKVYTSPSRFVELGEDDSLDGGDVLPGLTLPIGPWLDEAARTGPRE
jgi:Uma2 family endonuclease